MAANLLLLTALVLINAILAASEIALISANKNKIRLLAAKGNGRALQLSNMLADPSNFLATIQIGITLAGFLASAFAAEGFSHSLAASLTEAGLPLPDIWISNISVVIITVILAYFTLVLGELLPKRLAMKKAESLSLLLVRPLYLLSRIAYPFVRLLSISTNTALRLLGFDPSEDDRTLTEEEIRLMLDAGQQKGTIEEAEKIMIDNIFEFNDKPVGSIMTHRTDVFALPAETSLNDVLNAIGPGQYSRIPVYKGTLDNIIGVLYLKDIIRIISSPADNEDFVLESVTRKPFFVPASKRIDELLKDMKGNKTHMAVVIDEYGGTAGIVTLEDLLEEIVGDIEDEYDEEEHAIRELDDRTLIIDGSARLESVKEFLNIDLPVDEYETLNGFVIGQLGKIPGEGHGHGVEFNGLYFTVEETMHHRITRIKVSRI